MEFEHDHSPTAIAARLAAGPKPNYLRDFIYGGIDGAVTTFAVVAGVVGADLSSKVLIILGLANLFADGFSMAASNYSGTKAEADDYRRLREIEKRHVALEPFGEREEIRQIFRAKGFRGNRLAGVVNLLTSDPEVWIDTMLHEEYGVGGAMRSPQLAALATFAAFLMCGLVPLLPFLFGMPASAALATIMTALVFFVIGSVKSRWSTQHWLTSGLETTVIGLAAAGVAYLVGAALKQIV